MDEFHDLWDSIDINDKLQAIEYIQNQPNGIILAAECYHSLLHDHDVLDVATDMFKKAAELGHIPSILKLATLTNSLEYWHLASEYQDSIAIIHLAHYYQAELLLDDMNQDIQEQMIFFSQRASELGDSKSASFLAFHAYQTRSR